MKIYPGVHDVVTSEEITVNHIPLSFFSEASRNVTPIIEINEKVSHKQEDQIIYPYQQFDTDDILLFDQNNNPVDSTTYLKRNGQKYYFEPVNSTEFVPTEFKYSVLVSRNDTFKNNINYNLKIGCYTTFLSERVIGLVNGESQYKPKNIIVNDNSLLPTSLIDLSIDSADFLFINYNDLTDSLLEECLTNHVNLWLTGEEFDNLLSEDNIVTSYKILNPEIYQTDEYTLDGYTKVRFDISKELEKFPKDEYQYISLFESAIPILILRKENGAFLILSHSSILDHIDTCYQLIFEIMMKVYNNSYFATHERTNYIADNKIDYFLKNYQKFNQYHPRINLTDHLISDGYNSAINYDLVTVNIDRDDVIFRGVNKYKDLIFRKTSITDPEKPNDAVSIFTAKNTIIHYRQADNLIKTIEDKLTIGYKYIDDVDYITVAGFRSSKEKINTLYEVSLRIDDTSVYYLCYSQSTQEFFIIRDTAYNSNEEAYGKIYATISLNIDEKLSCGDIRVIGGGDLNPDSNYELIDTGSIKGRPYRLGSTMIIKLPERFKNQENIIKSELNKHVSSADYFILVFE